jgi:uncharacterized hydrophobic protein (TIGR00271 family)
MMRVVLQLRVFVPPSRVDAVVEALSIEGVHNVAHLIGVEVAHGDDLITAVVEPAAADAVVERVRSLRIQRPGAVAMIREDDTEVMPVEGDDIGHWDSTADAIVIEEVVDEARENARLSVTYLAYMVAAGVIAGIGVGQDQSVLVVGAMAISPDLLPLSAVCVGLVSGARRTAFVGVNTLLAGLGTAALASGVLVRLADAFGVLEADLESNVLTAFVTEPSPATVVVALAAGVAAMLSIERQAASAVGVAISVTTIPAAAAIGVALGLADWDQMVGATLVLGLNLIALMVAGSLTLSIQLRRGHPIAGRTMHGPPLPARRGRQTSMRPPARQ